MSKMSDAERQEQQSAMRAHLSPVVETKTTSGDEKKTSVTITGADGIHPEKINKTFEISSSGKLYQNDGHYVYTPDTTQTDHSGSSASRIVFFKKKWYIMAGEKLDDGTLSKGNIMLMHAVVDCPPGNDNCELKDCVSQKWSEYQDAGSGKVTTKENANIKMIVTGDFSDIPSKLEAEPVSPAAASVASGGPSVAPAAASAASGGPSAEVAKEPPIPDPTRLAVREIPTLEEMKTVVTNIDKEYGNVSTEYGKLSANSSELDWTDFQKKILTQANSKLVEASSQLEEYKKPKGVDTTSLLAPEVDKSLEVDKSQGSESSKKQYETLLSILKNIPDMKQSCKENDTFIPIFIFLVLAKRAIDDSKLPKNVVDTSLLDPNYFLVEHDAHGIADAVNMQHFIAIIIIHSILQNLSSAKIVDTQAAAATEAQAPEKRENVWETIRTNQAAHQETHAIRPVEQQQPEQPEQSAFSFMRGGGDITKDTKIQCKLYQTVLDTISSFPLDDNSSESLGDILIKVIIFMRTENFKKVLKEKWDKATESGYDGGSSSSKSKKNKKSYKSHKSYHPKIGKTRKHHNTHNKPKRVSFVHQS